MAVMGKLKRVLKQAFPPPDKIRLDDHDGIIGVVTSERFRDLSSMDRQNLIEEVLQTGLSKEEQRRVLIIVTVTPEEEQVHSAAD